MRGHRMALHSGPPFLLGARAQSARRILRQTTLCEVARKEKGVPERSPSSSGLAPNHPGSDPAGRPRGGRFAPLWSRSGWVWSCPGACACLGRAAPVLPEGSARWAPTWRWLWSPGGRVRAWPRPPPALAPVSRPVGRVGGGGAAAPPPGRGRRSRSGFCARGLTRGRACWPLGGPPRGSGCCPGRAALRARLVGLGLVGCAAREVPQVRRAWRGACYGVRGARFRP